MRPDRSGSFLSGVRVLEVADELGEYCGKLLAGLGADVIKVEPPGGEVTRTYGPFYENSPGPGRSLYFWHYNLGKLGVTIDLDDPAGQERFRQLARDSDLVIDTRRLGYLDERGVGFGTLREANPALLYLRISPFGDDGPWAGYQACDLVHLALGGVAMNCGYDPEPNGFYDLPPIAPQMWQSYHIAGEMAALGVLGALVSRVQGSSGQRLSVSVHDAVAKNTETDLPNWVYLRQTHYRRTCRHSLPIATVSQLGATKDGRWLLPYRSYLPGILDGWDGTIRLLDKYGFAQDFTSEAYNDPKKRAELGTRERLSYLTDELVGSLRFDRDLWLDAQAEGLPWAPLRLPEENIDDEHWQRRETFLDVEHPEFGRTFTYVGAKWVAPEVPWVQGPRAPLVGEHNAELLEAPAAAPRPAATAADAFPVGPGKVSALGHPFALSGVRVVDLAWLLASAGAGRYLAAMGAEVIKVEHKTRWDAMRWGAGQAPAGGRAERDVATGPITPPPPGSPDRGGAFMEFNAGKLGVSLNLKDPRGREILERLIRDADIVTEGFSPGTMERMGLGYERLKEINPRIIYVQQSGMGQVGTYGSARSFGPTAAALSGLSEMSGLPAPYAPAGIGYSYLDWFGAYNMAVAIMAALYRRATTGKGCYIDSSQVESGTYLAGTAVLDYTANGQHWQRYGNRSPYKPAAPHGIYRTKGEDRWIAIGCFTEEQWRAALTVLGCPELGDDPRFADLYARLANQDALDAAITARTEGREGYSLMDVLQQAGVPAGVCQNAEDRCDNDPQLAHLGWLVELEQTEIGRWPVKEFPVKFSETPAYIGGIKDRSGPSYGQDNEYVYGSILGLSPEEIKQLTEDGVL